MRETATDDQADEEKEKSDPMTKTDVLVMRLV